MRSSLDTNVICDVAELIPDRVLSERHLDSVLFYIGRANEEEALVYLIVNLPALLKLLEPDNFLHISLALLDFDELLVPVLDSLVLLPLLVLDAPQTCLLVLNILAHPPDILFFLLLLLGRVEDGFLSSMDSLQLHIVV